MPQASSYSHLPMATDSSSDESVEATKMTKRKTSKMIFGHKTRLWIMSLLLICLTLSQINSITFNFTVICMDDVIKMHHLGNFTGPHWMESATQKSFLFSSTAIGAMLGLIPSVYLINLLGIRVILTGFGFISSMGSLLFPMTVDAHYYLVIACRIIQGFGISIVFTVVGVIPGVWAPRKETGTFLAILSCAFQLSMIVCMPVSGVLCESSMGWRSIYYLFGIVTLLAYSLFFSFYTDSPRFHRNVSGKELKQIEEGKFEIPKESVPYWDICTDPTVLATWISILGGNFGFIILTLYGPMYFKDVLHFDVKETGVASALPFILSAIIKFLAGRISDKMDSLSEKTRFTFFAVVSQASVVLGLIVMSFTKNRRIAQIAYTFAITSSGLNIVGNIKCIQLRCRQHVHFTMTVVSFFAYITHFGAPIVVGHLFSNAGNMTENWSQLFVIVAAVIFVTNVPFPFLTSDEPGPFLTNIKTTSENV